MDSRAIDDLHALVARDREAKGTKRMPLAQVEELLASEYGRRGQKQLQARELINAARSRLDLDQPEQARRLVTEANEIHRTWLAATRPTLSPERAMMW